jgi:LysR family hydrogen peroxide-inducible transcriptional activator
MERPTLRQLECAVAVAEHLSFRRAAEACFITQPALSLAIQQLETLLGTRLFERDRRRVLLTPAGEELVPRARAALAETDALVEAARVLRDPLAGTLRMGVIPTVAPYVLPSVVPLLRRRYPALRLLLQEEQTARLVERTQRGRLDLCLLALEADLGGLTTRALYFDPFVLAAPQGHDLAKRKHAREQDLAQEEVLLLEDGHCLREQALSICSRSGAREHGDFRATSLNTLVRMVAGGTGVTLLPAMAVPGEVHAPDRLAIVPLERRSGRTIGLAWRPSSPRVRAFEALAEALVEKAPAGTVPLAAPRRR